MYTEEVGGFSSPDTGLVGLMIYGYTCIDVSHSTQSTHNNSAVHILHGSTLHRQILHTFTKTENDIRKLYFKM